MGILYYGSPETAIRLQERTLAHLKVVVLTKLRRGESFSLSWVHPAEDGPGRSTVWLHPSVPLRFVFDEVDPPELSGEWLEELAAAAYSTSGIRLDASHLQSATRVQ